MVGKESILGTNGPLCTERESIELIMRVVLDAKPWLSNPSVFPKLWTSFKIESPLKVAIQWCDDIVTPHPPVTRALREVSEACKLAGMDVVDWVSLDHGTGWEITSGLYFPDGGEEVMSLLRDSGEPVLPLTDFIINQQPNVKNRNQKELWEVCLILSKTILPFIVR